MTEEEIKRDIQLLYDRISSLDERIRALEEEKGFKFMRRK